MAVDERYRKQGIGKALMERVEDGLRAAGCTKLNLQVRSSNTVVVKFYKNLGYDIEDRVSMGKRLV
jgi:ribosomal protein S18 acetylase RimI-like enzyme